MINYRGPSTLLYGLLLIFLVSGCEQNLHNSKNLSETSLQYQPSAQNVFNRAIDQKRLNNIACSTQDQFLFKPDEKIALIVGDTQVVDLNSFSTTETGTANLTFHYSESLLSGSVVFTETEPTKVHVHQSFAGQTGDLIFALVQSTTNPAVWNIESTTDPMTGTLSNMIDVDTLLAGGYYINVHFGNEVNSPTLRAQITNDNIKTQFALLVAHKGIITTASGFSGVSINENKCNISAYITLTDVVDVSGVHLHIEDENGTTSNKIILEADDSVTDKMVYKIADADQMLSASDIENINAGHWYVNVHTAINTSGELIGYLDHPHIDSITLNVDASQVVDRSTANSTDLGVANFLWDTVSGMFGGMVSFPGEAPTKVHIHQGFAGQTGDLVIELVQNSIDATIWEIAQADYSVLDQAVLEQGGYYLNVHLVNGIDTLRSQIIHHGISASIAALEAQPGILTEATGFAGITVAKKILADGGTAIKGYVTLTGLTDVTGVHLHIEDIDLATTQKIILEVNPNGVYEIPVDTILSAAANMDIVEERWYINVHTTINVDGEIIGQLEAIP